MTTTTTCSSFFPRSSLPPRPRLRLALIFWFLLLFFDRSTIEGIVDSEGSIKKNSTRYQSQSPKKSQQWSPASFLSPQFSSAPHLLLSLSRSLIFLSRPGSLFPPGRSLAQVIHSGLLISVTNVRPRLAHSRGTATLILLSRPLIKVVQGRN